MDNEAIYKKYMFFVRTNSPELCGDFAAGLTDVQAKTLFERLEREKLAVAVQPLWFSYERQEFRW